MTAAAPLVSARSGAALAAVVVLLLIIDCVVLGTLHLALLERRVADNGRLAFELRIAAENALHAEAAAWSPDLDLLAIGTRFERAGHDGRYGTLTSIERISAGLFLVRAVSRAPAPLHGAAAAAALVLPPLLPHGIDAASAAVTAAALTVAAGGSVVAETSACTESPRAVSVTDAAAVHDPAGGITGAVAVAPADSLALASFDRVLAVAAGAGNVEGLELHPGSLRLANDTEGVLIVDGDLEVTAAFRGLLLVSGNLTVAPNGSVSGAAHVAGAAAIDGAILLEACAVREQLRRTGLAAARLLPARPALPAF